MTSAGHLSLAARLTLPRSGYVCARCRLKASTAVRTTNSLITLPYASRRHASWLDSDTLRKKIWGSETPPGQEDPYGKESVFDRKRREREQEGEQEGEHDGGKGRELELVPERQVGKPEGQTKYVKATTAEGLETVGGPDWGTTAWETRNVKNSFEGFGQLYCEHCDAY